MGVSPLCCHTFLYFDTEFCWFICQIDFLTKSFNNNFFYLLQHTSTSLSAATQCPISPKLLLNPFWMSISLLPPSMSPDCAVLKSTQILKWVQAIYQLHSWPLFSAENVRNCKYSPKLQFRKSKVYQLYRSLVSGWSWVSSASLMQKQADKTFCRQTQDGG